MNKVYKMFRKLIDCFKYCFSIERQEDDMEYAIANSREGQYHVTIYFDKIFNSGRRIKGYGYITARVILFDGVRKEQTIHYGRETQRAAKFFHKITNLNYKKTSGIE